MTIALSVSQVTVAQNTTPNPAARWLSHIQYLASDVWTAGTSGVGQNNATTVSYYVKGPVVGFLLDAKIRRVTVGKKSLDDVMSDGTVVFNGQLE